MKKKKKKEKKVRRKTINHGGQPPFRGRPHVFMVDHDLKFLLLFHSCSYSYSGTKQGQGHVVNP